MSGFEVFEELWWRYEDWFVRNVVTAENELRLLELVLKASPRPFLEVGVGSGWFASKLGVEFGLDPAVNMLRLARARGIEVIAGVGEYLPFRDGVFGTVLIIVTLCFADNPQALFSESRRVLKVGGHLITCFIPKDSTWGSYYSSKDSPFYRVARFYTLSDVRMLLEEAGLKIRSIWSTLRSYGPRDEAVAEEPVEGAEGGFVCVKSVRQ